MNGYVLRKHRAPTGTSCSTFAEPGLPRSPLTVADKYRSGLPSSLPENTEYGNFELRNAHSLVGVDDTTFNSSAGRWNGTFDDADIWLELISATSGLNIAFGDTPTMDLTAGNTYALGAGNAMFAVKPTFWVDGGL